VLEFVFVLIIVILEDLLIFLESFLFVCDPIGGTGNLEVVFEGNVGNTSHDIEDMKVRFNLGQE